jgi:hypothetical protein
MTHHTEQHGPFIETRVKEIDAKLKADYDKLLRIDEAFGELLSFPLFCKLAALRKSRSYMGAGMVPFCDMMVSMCGLL